MIATLTEVSAFITSCVTAVVLLITTLATMRNGKAVKVVDGKVDEVHEIATDVQHQVTTLNGKTIAVLADNIETRRIEALPKSDQTEGDKEHIVDVPPPA